VNNNVGCTPYHTDDSLDNLQVRGFSFKGMVGCSEASTHPTLTHATLAVN